jgi:uncharacterized protein YecE (DUF72 family)
MIKVGTSGFSFPYWKGTVYPPGLPEKEMLPFYEKEMGFNILEVNFTYYSLPSQKSFEAMSKKTSRDFEFVVKAYKEMTHEIRDKATGRIADNHEVFEKFKFSLAPLIRDGKLNSVLAQFPYGFFPNRDTFAYLQRFKEAFSEIPLAYEFRNQSWVRESTFQFLEKNGIAFCIVDEPKLPKLLPYTPRVTSEIGYFRFHGRNPDWFRASRDVRYNYLYSEQELNEFVPDIKKISMSTAKTLVFFNNCYSGHAAKNAAQMAKLLKESSEA